MGTIMTFFALIIFCFLSFSIYPQVSYLFRPALFENYSPKRPNIILILTDDQDISLGGFDFMPKVHELISNRGLTFENSYVSTPLCCPSRSTILTGKYVHNHKTVNNSLSGRCSSVSWQRSHETRTFPVSLQQHSYKTFFAGKYLNQYGSSEAGGLKHVPPGWNKWIGLKGNSVYYNYTLSVDGEPEHHQDDPEVDYLTNIIRNRALDFLEDQDRGNSPFFMMLSTPSCHAPFTPEPKYSKTFQGLKAPRTPNYNVINDGSKHWLLRLGEQPLRESFLDKIDGIYRNRLRTLLTVDDMVSDVYQKLEEKSLLDNTYILFTSDNGYHLGQFSLPIDKREPYEFDIKVPLAITGPGISRSRSNRLVSNVDLAPTILDLAGIQIPPFYDGTSWKNSLSVHVPSAGLRDTYEPIRKTILVEHTGEYGHIHNECQYLGEGLGQCNPEFNCKCSDSKNNTYSCLRHMSSTQNFVYCAWDDGENFEEFYDLDSDGFQLQNSVNDLPPRFGKRLRYLLEKYTTCRGARCQKLTRFVV